MHLASHESFDGRPDQNSSKFVDLQLYKNHSKGHLWMEAGPDCPVGLGCGVGDSPSLHTARFSKALDIIPVGSAVQIPQVASARFARNQWHPRPFGLSWRALC